MERVRAYEYLKAEYQKLSLLLVDINLLKQLKIRFQPKIYSVRKLSLVCSLDDLFRLLERLDQLNETNIQPLFIMNSIILDSRLQYLCENYEARYILQNQSDRLLPSQSSHIDVRMVYQWKKITYLAIVCVSIGLFANNIHKHMSDLRYHSNATLPLNRKQENKEILDHRGKAFKVISEKLGQKWKVTARGLGLSEGEIEEIIKSSSDIREQILMMLTKMEESVTYEPRKLRSNLERALRRANRVDLSETVAQIFDS